MKNKSMLYICFVMLIAIIVSIVNILKYRTFTIDKSISNKVWYRYNYTNGLYETLEFKGNNINYFKPTSTNNTNSLDNCTKYTYDKKNKTIKLNCKKDIKIINNDNNSLSLEFDGKSEKYFLSIEDSLNYEFETYFEKSIIDYKKERIQVTDFSKINQNKLIEVLKDEENSKIIFIGNKCTSVDCVLALDIMEKWVSTNENIYYFDVNDLNSNIINYINNISSIKHDYNSFDNIYPKILVSRNNRILDEYDIKCTGFNCTKYYKNEF